MLFEGVMMDTLAVLTLLKKLEQKMECVNDKKIIRDAIDKILENLSTTTL